MKELACPRCDDDTLRLIFNSSPRQLEPGWMFPCPNCLEFVMVTPEGTFRSATRQERLIAMTHPPTRERIDSFMLMAKEYRRLRVELILARAK